MKQVKLDTFKINSSIARSIAEGLWGRGGTNSAKTTKQGFYYYSCSGHGGYVVDKNMLSKEQQELVNTHHETTTMDIAVGYSSELDTDVVFDWINPYGRNRTSANIPYGIGNAEWRKHEFYMFEEDCDWAIVEAITGVRLQWRVERCNSTEKYNDAIKESLARWYPILLKEIHEKI
jgi:hypothetical protein